MIPMPEGLMPWASRLEKVFAKPYPPVAEPDPDRKPLWEKFSNWSLICEEMLDTEPYPRFLRMCYDELHRRGLDDATIQEMRRFAWLTVGWLNFERMLWEWVHLDDDDIGFAIQQQYAEKLITIEEHSQLMDYLQKHRGSTNDSAPSR
jgi:hypothetical protein